MSLWSSIGTTDDQANSERCAMMANHLLADYEKDIARLVLSTCDFVFLFHSIDRCWHFFNIYISPCVQIIYINSAFLMRTVSSAPVVPISPTFGSVNKHPIVSRTRFFVPAANRCTICCGCTMLSKTMRSIYRRTKVLFWPPSNRASSVC